MLLSEAKILIIDDDVDVLSAAKLLLKRHAKAVDIEKNPQKLPFLVTNGDYNLILLDMMMPNMSGIEVLTLREPNNRVVRPPITGAVVHPQFLSENHDVGGPDRLVLVPFCKPSWLLREDRPLDFPGFEIGGGPHGGEGVAASLKQEILSAKLDDGRVVNPLSAGSDGSIARKDFKVSRLHRGRGQLIA